MSRQYAFTSLKEICITERLTTFGLYIRSLLSGAQHCWICAIDPSTGEIQYISFEEGEATRVNLEHVEYDPNLHYAVWHTHIVNPFASLIDLIYIYQFYQIDGVGVICVESREKAAIYYEKLRPLTHICKGIISEISANHKKHLIAMKKALIARERGDESAYATFSEEAEKYAEKVEILGNELRERCFRISLIESSTFPESLIPETLETIPPQFADEYIRRYMP